MLRASCVADCSGSLFGRQGAIEIVATIGDYVMAGMMLTAVDQQLTPNLKPLLPPTK